MKKQHLTVLLLVFFQILIRTLICFSAEPGCICPPGEGASPGVTGGGSTWGGKGMGQVLSGIDPRGRLSPMFILGIILLILALIILVSIFVYQRLEQDRIEQEQRDQDWAWSTREYLNNVNRAREEKERNDRVYQEYANSMRNQGDFPMPQEQFNTMFTSKLKPKPSVKFNKSVEPIPSSAFNFQVGNNSIGRGEENNVCINDEKISTNHADLTITPEGQYILTDLGSSNGTFVNGQKITQCCLNGGDQILMGDTTIIV